MSKCTNLPCHAGSSSCHSVLMACARSLITWKRVANAVPWCSISSAFQPAPMPSSKRPPESRSRLAAAFAVVSGSRSVSRQMPVPTRSVFVAAAAAVSATKGSRVFQYSLGRSGPPGQGLRRLAGMWVCSGTNSDSKPRASASRASSSMRMAYSVAKMKMPMFMGSSLRWLVRQALAAIAMAMPVAALHSRPLWRGSPT